MKNELTLKAAMKLLWNKKFSFSGRSTRDEYWLSLLGLNIIEIIVVFMLMTLFFITTGISIYSYNELSNASALFIGLEVIINGIIGIIFSIIVIALNARRLHDIDKSGWWQLITCIPMVGIIIFFFWMIDVSTEDNKYGVKVNS